MKKFLFTFTILSIALAGKCQIQPLIYTPYNSDGTQMQMPETRARTTTVYAYYIQDGNFVKTSIKIKETDYSMFVVSYLVRNDYGSYWQDLGMGIQVQQVSNLTDNRVIAENFYYKAYIPSLLKYIYF